MSSMADPTHLLGRLTGLDLLLQVCARISHFSAGRHADMSEQAMSTLLPTRATHGSLQLLVGLDWTTSLQTNRREHDTETHSYLIEIDAVVGSGRLTDWTDERGPPYVTALVKELHRWAPIAVAGKQSNSYVKLISRLCRNVRTLTTRTSLRNASRYHQRPRV